MGLKSGKEMGKRKHPFRQVIDFQIKKWCRECDLNTRPTHYECVALKSLHLNTEREYKKFDAKNQEK